jgi:protoporphyrinogen oxidase
VSPALQGIYGTQSDNLSAEIVIKGFLDKKSRVKKGVFKGSIAPENGMQEIAQQLEMYLKQKKVVFHFHRSARIEELTSDFTSVVVATSHRAASVLLKNSAPQLAAHLALVPTLPLVSVTLAFASLKKITGFGCLFPVDQGFNSLGVLFNTDIFAKRGSLESETWIIGQEIKEPDQILDMVLADRKKLLQTSEKPQFHKITNWPAALPLYGEELQRLLSSGLFEKFKPLSENSYPLYLTGNYLGFIGLAKILDYNIKLAESISQN